MNIGPLCGAYFFVGRIPSAFRLFLEDLQFWCASACQAPTRQMYSMWTYFSRDVPNRVSTLERNSATFIGIVTRYFAEARFWCVRLRRCRGRTTRVTWGSFPPRDVKHSWCCLHIHIRFFIQRRILNPGRRREAVLAWGFCFEDVSSCLRHALPNRSVLLILRRALSVWGRVDQIK